MLSLYPAIRDKLFGTYRIPHRIGGDVVIDGGWIRVFGCVGISYCVDALFGMPRRSKCGAASPRSSRG